MKNRIKFHRFISVFWVAAIIISMFCISSQAADITKDSLDVQDCEAFMQGKLKLESTLNGTEYVYKTFSGSGSDYTYCEKYIKCLTDLPNLKKVVDNYEKNYFADNFALGFNYIGSQNVTATERVFLTTTYTNVTIYGTVNSSSLSMTVSIPKDMIKDLGYRYTGKRVSVTDSSGKTDTSSKQTSVFSDKKNSGAKSITVRAVDGTEIKTTDSNIDMLFDNIRINAWRPWYDPEDKPFIIWGLSEAAPIIGYSITAAYDYYGYQYDDPPTAWTLYGSKSSTQPARNSKTWVKLHSVSNAKLIDNKEYEKYTAQTLDYKFKKTTDKYRYYKLEINDSKAEFYCELAEFELRTTADYKFVPKGALSGKSNTYTYDVSVGDYIILVNFRQPASAYYAYGWFIDSGREYGSTYDGIGQNSPTLWIDAKKVGKITITGTLDYTQSGTYKSYNYEDKYIINVVPEGQAPHTDTLGPVINAMDKTGKKKCPKCGGEGTVTVTKSTPNYGGGVRRYKVKNICPRCRGFGYV